jgi:hypothetical protein
MSTLPPFTEPDWSQLPPEAVAVWGSAIGNTMSYMGASQLITATARSRCEAYLRTIGKWRTE